MSPTRLIRTVETIAGVAPGSIRSRDTTRQVVRARRAVIGVLSLRGLNSGQIALVLQKDVSTIRSHLAALADSEAMAEARRDDSRVAAE